MRRNFSSSGLVRLLGAWGHGDGDVLGADFAQRLSPWLGPFHATALHAAHQSIKAMGQHAGPTLSASTAALEEEVQRVYTALARGFTASTVTATYSQRADRRWGQPAVVEAVDDAQAQADYAPHHRRYLDQQHQMEGKIEALRGHVRQAVSRVSAPLRQLAALDAAMEPVLAAHEQKLLSTVPAFLEQRFDTLRQAHQQQLLGSGREDEPARNLQPTGWLAVFGRDLQALLLAELNVRMEPVTGLMEALSNDVNTHT